MSRPAEPLARPRRRAAQAPSGYQDVFEHANDLMVIHDERTGAIVEANRKACETYGYNVEQLRRLEIGDLTRGGTRFNTPEGLRRIREAVHSRQPVIFEWVILDGRGREVPVEVNLQRIKVGNRHRVLAIARDISERKRAEALLRERERYYRRLIENSTDGLAILAADGRIRFVGPSIHAMLGVPDRFLIGRSVFRFLAPDDLAAARAWLAEAPADGSTLTYRVRHVDGGWRIHEASSRPMFDDPSIGGLLVNFRDVTERVRAQDTLRQQEQQLAQAARASATGEMAAAIAHELNQPLSAIVNFLAGCRRRLDHGDMARGDLLDVLGLTQHEAERAGRIIKSLRDFLAKREAQRQVLDLRCLLADVVGLIDFKASRLGVEVRYDRLRAAPLKVECDDVLIQQVILNLAVNAIESMEATPPGERRLRIHLAARRRDVEVSIADTGPGLPVDGPERIFDAFWSTKKDGLGIGLSLCRSIIDSHGGQLWASRSDAGETVFHFTLPRAGGPRRP